MNGDSVSLGMRILAALAVLNLSAPACTPVLKCAFLGAWGAVPSCQAPTFKLEADLVRIDPLAARVLCFSDAKLMHRGAQRILDLLRRARPGLKSVRIDGRAPAQTYCRDDH
jgi:hypothetical protein